MLTVRTERTIRRLLLTVRTNAAVLDERLLSFLFGNFNIKQR